MIDWVGGEVDDEGDVATQVEGEGDAHQGDEDVDVHTDLDTKIVDCDGDDQEGDEDIEVHGEGEGDAQEGDAQDSHAQEGHGLDAEVHEVEDGEVHHVEQPGVHELDDFEVEDLGEDDDDEDSDGEDVHEQEGKEEELHDEEVHVSDESLIDVSVHCEADIGTSKGNVREEHFSPLLESSQSRENEKNMHDVRGLADDEWLSEELINGSESEEDDGSSKVRFPTFNMPKSLEAYKWKACKDTFVCCRPIIGLDGCFLKGKYGRELLTAVGRDGNEQMLPIAYVVVEVENKDGWTWFLELLIEDLDGKDVCAGITFISDQQKVND
ncbi:sodium/potassium/calcium exchanger 1-like [Vigna radiata var. radiata]|uniref:Sodium/potassium/calcium exchanger 1-like n=1 Tax=Vigna radiata var. radiata TaxID=3916 RepID=A0A1S3TAP4_VIGRR|nr:sodium/potassium/calcium exchanger 1-like [Vigna radiata var. radiata]